jgi:hypothetical protein
MLFRKFIYTAFLFAALAMTAACGDPENDFDAFINEEGCQHLDHGPFVSLGAVTSPTGAEPIDAPAVKANHRAYQVLLPDDDRGFAKFESGEAMNYVIFMDTDVHFHVREWVDGERKSAPIIDSQQSVEQCGIVKARHVVDLGIGNYYLDFGNDHKGETVTVVIEPYDADVENGHGHDHDHDHDD